MHRTVSLRAFLLGMILFAAALAGSIALLKYEWAYGLFVARSLLLLTCLGLVLAAAYPAPRLRRAALAALAAIAVQSYFGDPKGDWSDGSNPTVWVLRSVYVQFIQTPPTAPNASSAYGSSGPMTYNLNQPNYGGPMPPGGAGFNWSGGYAPYPYYDAHYDLYMQIAASLTALWIGALVGGLTLLFPIGATDDKPAAREPTANH